MAVLNTTRSMIVLTVALTLLAGLGCATTRHGSAVAAGQPGQSGEFVATDLEGYWQCSLDGSVTHITNVGLPGGGSGSDTQPGGTMVPEGRFRNIRFLGGHQWEALEMERPLARVPGEPEDPFAWRRVVIEMVDRNTFVIGKMLYRRV